ncbi:hypothetical protein THH46_12510 [Pseudomonas sp. NA13]
MGLGSDKNSIGLEDQTRRAASGLMAKIHAQAGDFDYVVFQQNLVSTPTLLASTWDSQRRKSNLASMPRVSVMLGQRALCWAWSTSSIKRVPVKESWWFPMGLVRAAMPLP